MREVRLIDANAYIDEINERIDAAIKWGCNAIADGNSEIKLRAEQAVATFCEAALTAKKMPTIDPVKHGRWEKIGKLYQELDNDSDFVWACTVCMHQDVHNEKVEVPYCWYCGSRMDGEENGTDD